MSARPQAPTEVASPGSGGNGRRGLVDLTVLAVEDVLRLVQQEIQLAKLEVKEMLVSSAWGGALLAGIESGVFLVLSAVLGLIGKSRLRIGPPPKTMTTLKEDAAWAKNLLK